MEVKTFRLDIGIASTDNIDTLYTNTKPDTQHLLSILEAEERLLHLLAYGGDTSTVPLFSLIMKNNNVDIDNDEDVSVFTHKLIPYERFAKQRHTLSLHKGIFTSTMFRDIHAHLVLNNGGYVAHLISYEQMGGVGIDDVYISLSQPASITENVIKVLLLELFNHVKDRRLIAYEYPQIMASVISSLEGKK